jgi:hypothetical protein
MNDLPQRVSDDPFRTPLHRTDIIGDDITEPDALSADARGPVDQRSAENRFEAAHQSPGVTFNISFDGATTDMGAGVGLVKDCARNRDVILLERSQHRNIVDDGAKRRVRRPEIQTATRHDRSETKRPSTHFAVSDLALYFCAATYRENPETTGISKQNNAIHRTLIPSRGVDESCGIGP